MNRVCIWTQTYGSGRDELFDYHALDAYDIEFRNNFDNLYTFHNCDDKFFDKISNGDYLNQIKNKNILRYDGINYTECVRKSIEHIKNMGYEYIVYQQDDSFFQFSPKFESDKYEKLLKVIEFIKNNDFDMINLEWSGEVIVGNNPIDFFENDNLKIYNTTSLDFGKFGVWEFDDGAYIAKIDFILENLYDSDYFNIGDIWRGEEYLKNNWSSKSFPRKTLQIGLYSRYNLLGRNSNYPACIEKLKCKFL